MGGWTPVGCIQSLRIGGGRSELWSENHQYLLLAPSFGGFFWGVRPAGSRP